MGFWLSTDPITIVQGEDAYLHLWRTENVQVITVSAPTVGTVGTFTLTWRGGRTVPIDIGASAADVQAALSAIATVSAGGVLVTGSAGGPWTVTPQRALALSLQPLIAVTATAFSEPDASVSVGNPAHDVTGYTANGKLADQPTGTSLATYATVTETAGTDGQIDLTDAAAGHVVVWIKAATTATFTFTPRSAQLDVQLITAGGIVEAWVSSLVQLARTVF